MSALVSPVCGHANHLMDVDSMRGAPQVHVHFLTEEPEFRMLGYNKLELCCHGCGASLLVYYDHPTEEHHNHLQIRDSFVESHKRCPNRGYENWCPNERFSFGFLDIRIKKEADGAHSESARTGGVPFNPPTMARRHRHAGRKPTPPRNR